MQQHKKTFSKRLLYDLLEPCHAVDYLDLHCEILTDPIKKFFNNYNVMNVDINVHIVKY